MTADRLVRDRVASLESDLGALDNETISLDAPFVGKVYDGGQIPQGSERFYMVHPVDFDGQEKEGQVATSRVDTTRSIPVVFLGSRQPLVDDQFVVHPIGGRWLAYTGAFLPNCNPRATACTGKRFAVNGTVEDALHGTQPMVYDFAKGAWYSPWLQHTSNFILATSPGVNPCAIGTGVSYYYYTLTTSGSQPVVNMIMLGEQSCRKSNGTYTSAYYGYPGANYPRLFGPPADSLISGFTVSSVGDPVSCDPLSCTASFVDPSIKATLPVTTANFSVPVQVPPSYGFTCTTPCPLPRRDLTVSWIKTGGNGSGVLKYDVLNKDWKMVCDNGITIRLFATGSLTWGFTVTFWDTPDCTGAGASHPFNYPAQLGVLSYDCEPLLLSFIVIYTTSMLYLRGYRSFAVTL